MHTETLENEMKSWRQAFHRCPEIGFEEHATSARVAELLEGFGLQVHRGVGHTGVVGLLHKGTGNRTIGLRADMDALPITETTGLPHASETAGAMHACGHDGHTAMLLGAAKYLATEGDFSGRVAFIFQPAEEHGKGAQAMIEDGLFERFGIEEVYAIHNMPGLPLGHVETRTGPMTAAESLFEIKVMASGGHAALPHLGVDAITVAAEIVTALQTIVARKLDPAAGGVVSVTEFETDGARNVLPSRAVLRGDARALTPEVNSQIEAKMRTLAHGIAAAHGVEAEVTYETIFAPTINADAPVRSVADASEALGMTCNSLAAPKFFSEDFAHMAAASKGCFLLMGNGTEGAHARPLHASDYDFNDALLGPGAAFWATLAEHRLRPGQP